jgi:rhodanese-related sulfurtransferase
MSAPRETFEIDIDPARVAEWLAEAGHIDGTRHIELVKLTSEAASIERERPVVFYCRVGGRSQMAAQAFRASGYEAYSMDGGLRRWVKEGRPLIPEGGSVADH